MEWDAVMMPESSSRGCSFTESQRSNFFIQEKSWLEMRTKKVGKLRYRQAVILVELAISAGNSKLNKVVSFSAFSCCFGLNTSGL